MTALDLLTTFPIIVLSLGVYFGLAFPMLIVLQHKNWILPGKPPRYWLGLFVFWPISQYIYSMLFIRNRLYAVSSVLGIVWVFTLYIAIIGTSAKHKRDLKLTLSNCEKIISKSKEMSMDEKADINGNIMILKNEIKFVTWSDFQSRKIQTDLVVELNEYLSDGQLNRDEYQNWSRNYKDRSRLPASISSSTKRAN